MPLADLTTYSDVPHPTRTLVFAIRRMAIGGLDDAQAATAMLAQFGLGYRRPLILTRTMMGEMARVSARTIAVAPCCSARLTSDEGVILRAAELSWAEPRAAHEALAELLGVPDCLGVLTTMQALSSACRDLGRPLGLFCLAPSPFVPSEVEGRRAEVSRLRSTRTE